MKYINAIVAIVLSSPFISAQSLPPALAADSARITSDALARAYVTPKKILATEGKVVGADLLLVPGTGQTDIFDNGMCRMVSTDDSTASILLDFGRELTGGIRITISACSPVVTPRMRVRLGESVSESCSDLKSSPTSTDGKKNTATNDHAMRDMVLTVPFYGQIETGNSGFRFARIDLLDKNVTINLKEVEAVMRYRDIPYTGSFSCSDPRLTEIWDTGAYTVHLCLQEYLWDGVKRDRLIWLGDMHPETSTIAAVFGSDPTVERTLDLACKQWPLPRWFNDMSAYSLWYLIIQHDWYMQSGNKPFLERHAPYIAGLIDRIESLVDEDGTERLSTYRFLDWPSSTDQAGVEAGYRALISWAMQSGEKLSKILADNDRAEKCRKVLKRMNRKKHPHNGLKQAAALMAIAGTEDADNACETGVSIGGAKGFSTFGGYYMLEALAKAGRHDEAIGIIRDFWGAMLDLGATTFWEDFDLEWAKNAGPIDRLPRNGETDIHADFGGYCYVGHRHSLCHGWGSGPTAWMSRHIPGVEVIEPGCRTVRIAPHLGDLEWAQGTYPTPYGAISVHHRRNSDGSIESTINAPEEIKIIK